MTKLGPKRIHTVRVRGGNLKYRALRLDSGNFAWGSEHVTKKTRLIGVVSVALSVSAMGCLWVPHIPYRGYMRLMVTHHTGTRQGKVLIVIHYQVYNASNNELVRTNTFVKSAIIQIDAAPFRQWYEAHVRIYDSDSL